MSYYAVIGHPIEHSLSPLIHQQFAQNAGISLHYEKILAEPAQFIDAIQQFRSQHGKGLNVTLPFKTDAIQICDRLSDYARKAGAVNTLHLREDGIITGHNTDGPGFILDLNRHNIALAEKKVLMLGAGGAIRGILPAILAEQPARLVIANRTAQKAKQLAEQYGVEGCDWAHLDNDDFDLIIHGTPIGRTESDLTMPTIKANANTVLYDLNYHSTYRDIEDWAKQLGVQYLDGLGMLVEQAALSFRIWHDHWPKTETVLEMLRGQ